MLGFGRFRRTNGHRARAYCRAVNDSGVETGGSGGSMNRGPELPRAPSGATKI